ncbi:GDP-mannose 4,6-dehydratase [Aurantimonas endophytica]|uniref:GDP-4-dehydro-6-deoxy-D-mannose reductase n=1 Tax=Aurantimonas endophytica TaxID=1522175 RepID=A0A7W6HDC1_9HYPH|nr:GDP-mannose 4,6-dehydratase [Aurantimonas endophytica]MBB4003071.1 GDP-4-dehydro-6-deoxy-D-mannose reductase [Aurantimonas endophytica]
MDPQHRVLITGAGGFVGTLLVRHLEAIRGDGASSVAIYGAAEGEAFDISDSEAADRAVQAARPTAVVHLAAIAAPAEAHRSPRRAWEVNLYGAMNLAEAVLRHAPEARFINVGSSEAYGDSFLAVEGPISEAAPLQPTSVYGATKAAADLMIGQMAHERLKAVRFRPFNHTAPGQADTYVVSAFARQIAAIMAGDQEPVISVGNLDVDRDFLDARDVVRAYAAAALDPFAPTGPASVYNLASGKAWRIGDILAKLIELSGMGVEVRVDPDRLRPNLVPRAEGDARKVASDLGWRPEIAFEDTLRDVLDFWRGHG